MSLLCRSRWPAAAHLWLFLLVVACTDARPPQAAQAAGMYSLIAGFGYIGDDDKADSWYQHGWLDTPLDLLTWLDKPRQMRANGAA